MEKKTPLQSDDKVESYLSVPFKEPPWARQLLREAGIEVDVPGRVNRLAPPDSGGPDIDDGLPDDPENSDPGYSVTPDFVFDIEVNWAPNDDLRMAIRRGLRGFSLGASEERFVDVRQMVVETPAPTPDSGTTPPPRRCLRTAVWWSSRWLDQDQKESEEPLPLELKAGPELIAARDRGMASVLPLASAVPNARAGADKKIFGMFLNASFIRRVILGVWNSLIRRAGGRIMDSGPRAGKPDPNGRIKLEGISIQILPPDTMKLVITGFSDVAWPPVPFTFTSTDVFQVSKASVMVTSANQLDADPIYQWIAAALSLSLAGLTYGLGYVFALAFLSTAIAAESTTFPEGISNLSPGKQLAGNLFLPVFHLGVSRLDMFYRSIHVGIGGITADGTQFVQGRRESVLLWGPENVAVDPDAITVFGLTDLSDIKFPCRVRWAVTSPATVTVFDQEVLSAKQIVYTNVIFNALPGASVGTVFRQAVQATVTGVDGFSATGVKQVMVYISTPPEEAETAEDAHCRQQPWKCQEEI